MQVCTLLQTDNHASTPPLSFFTGRMPFLPPNQQRQSTEGIIILHYIIILHFRKFATLATSPLARAALWILCGIVVVVLILFLGLQSAGTSMSTWSHCRTLIGSHTLQVDCTHRHAAPMTRSVIALLCYFLTLALGNTVIIHIRVLFIYWSVYWFIITHCALYGSWRESVDAYRRGQLFVLNRAPNPTT